MIEFIDVTKRFGEIEALTDINLTIRDNDFYGIIGMSGAGKSTLVRLINGLIRCDSGQVLVGGHDIAQLQEKELNDLRSSIGMIFQHFNLLSQKTVLENVALPLKLKGIKKEERERKAKEILSLVSLENKLMAYPAQLSGGQKQRVAIARALINDNKLILCDEATSALDPITTQSTLKLLKNLQETLGLTVIMITHEMAVIEQVCNRVAILDQGKLVEEGPVSEIFKQPKHAATRKLLGIKESTELQSNTATKLRLSFSGTKAAEPVVAELVLLTGQKMSILQADTRLIGDNIYGQLVISVDQVTEQMLSFLEEKQVDVSLVEDEEDHG